jgi:hypothetical protein
VGCLISNEKFKRIQITKSLNICIGYLKDTKRGLKVSMADKKVRIDEYLLEKIKKFRKRKKKNSIKYPSDKQFIQMAVMDLLEKEGEDEDR